MSGQARPRRTVANPGLRHRHPKLLSAGTSVDVIDDDRSQHGGPSDDNNVDLGELLTVPLQIATDIRLKVTVPVEGLPAMRDPPKLRVEQLLESGPVTAPQRFGPGGSGGNDLVFS